MNSLTGIDQPNSTCKIKKNKDNKDKIWTHSDRAVLFSALFNECSWRTEQLQSWPIILGKSYEIVTKIQNCKPLYLGLSRLCSATFEQLLAFGATFCGFSNLEQVLPFRAIFEQNIGLEHLSSTKKSTISWKTSIHANFLKAYHVINLLNT